ncbi:MAG TPA: PadR family transcriptional regulator [Micromonosporaceae bacterium]
MSMTRLLILGLVRMAQPVHGYEVRRELLSWRVDEWANLQPGSIYHSLKKLAEEGLLEAAEPEQVGNRPARTPYRITASGERVFQEMLRRYWWEYRQPVDPFVAAMSFLPVLSAREAAAALRNRAKVLRLNCDQLRQVADEGFLDPDTPSHVAEMFRLWIARSEGEIEWCERVAERVERGEFEDDSNGLIKFD